ncbi:Hint domain-containing protein [Pseudogemmobacter blasticus]|nr:Hint domain-containing protein [Fuscovulum blasticum]
MPVYSPTWIYVGNQATQINPDWNSPVPTQADTTLTEAQAVVGWEFGVEEMSGVQVTGNATGAGGVNFSRGVDPLSYTIEDGLGGTTSHTQLYTSHVVVSVDIAVARIDTTVEPNVLVKDTLHLRAVLVQMDNGDLFLRPYYQDVDLWHDALQDWGIDTITIAGVDTTSGEFNTDRTTDGLNAAAGFIPEFVTPIPEAPCFAAGARILTSEGEKAVETLKAGDLVMTRDNGFQAIRWIGCRVLSARQLQAAAYLCPIRIRAHAFGPGMPAEDLLVSPQHRVLVRSQIAERMFGEPEVLVAAKHLLGQPGIELAEAPQGVAYYHFILDGHQIVFSNGLATESLLATPRSINAMGAEARMELMALFSELLEDGMADPARPCVPGRRARHLVERHQKNGRPLLTQGTLAA